MKVHRSQSVRRAKVTTDGEGLVSHVGTGLLAELADRSGLTEGLSRTPSSWTFRRQVVARSFHGSHSAYRSFAGLNCGRAPWMRSSESRHRASFSSCSPRVKWSHGKRFDPNDLRRHLSTDTPRMPRGLRATEAYWRILEGNGHPLSPAVSRKQVSTDTRTSR